MTDVPTSNGTFTWNNRRKDFAYIAEKLDRFFIIGELVGNNINFRSAILPIAKFDHYPVRLELSEPHKPTRNPFKCEKMWFLDQNFLANIKDIVVGRTTSSILYNLLPKVIITVSFLDSCKVDAFTSIVGLIINHKIQ